ncbi:hypothetical protein PanWU01x14_126960 [Parasponia andersonii]|uniref:Uncharacterized protein n=1 Tax=Parasponia andersonii TaxID=3476 RepID=A0A2P5CT01_PARAD|nr:hypothetical protein PanWU01x14_126960 [Parasponia andersonii]
MDEVDEGRGFAGDDEWSGDEDLDSDYIPNSEEEEENKTMDEVEEGKENENADEVGKERLLNSALS